MRIEILDTAKRDFREGFWFYEEQSDGVGQYFVDSLMADIESLQLYAGVHAKKLGSIECAPGDFHSQSTIGLKKS